MFRTGCLIRKFTYFSPTSYLLLKVGQRKILCCSQHSREESKEGRQVGARLQAEQTEEWGWDRCCPRDVTLSSGRLARCPLPALPRLTVACGLTLPGLTNRPKSSGHTVPLPAPERVLAVVCPASHPCPGQTLLTARDTLSHGAGTRPNSPSPHCWELAAPPPGGCWRWWTCRWGVSPGRVLKAASPASI